MSWWGRRLRSADARCSLELDGSSLHVSPRVDLWMPVCARLDQTAAGRESTRPNVHTVAAQRSVTRVASSCGISCPLVCGAGKSEIGLLRGALVTLYLIP